MKKIEFTKMVASGNDFVVIDSAVIARRRGAPTKQSLTNLAKKICDRKFGIGADGLLVLGGSKRADIRMRIFNSDGSEAEMCGNGARCAAYVIARDCEAKPKQDRSNLKKRDCFAPSGLAMTIETKAGIIAAEVKDNKVRIQLTGPKGIKLNMPLRINARLIKVNFINTGVPHAVIFVEGLDRIDVASIGKQVRYHKEFAPAGTNVDFVEILNNHSSKVRTYERGVEDETLACGTGSVAAALLSAIRYPLSANKINVRTAGGEILKVYFSRVGNTFKDVWLEGKAKIVYRGEYYV